MLGAPRTTKWRNDDQGRTKDTLDSVPNIAYRVDDSTIKRTLSSFDHIPLLGDDVDWSGFSPELFVPTTYVQTSRGCPFSCAFCNYPAMAGNYEYATPQKVVENLIQLHSSGVQYVIFIDDTINVPRRRFKEILRGMINAGLDLKWVSFFRPSHADEETFDLMKDSGCLGVYIGIESGDPTLLKNMQKSATPDRMRYGIEQLSERGIITYGSFILGFPGETEATVDNTIEFLRRTPLTYYNMLLYYHDSLAPIQMRTQEFGIRGCQYSWQHDTMDWREAIDHIERVFRSVNTSIPCPLHGFAIWAFPYLMQKGIQLEQIHNFIATAKNTFLASFDDQPKDLTEEKERMAAIFRCNGDMS